jgi:outer membrane protein, multidrug efflux system
LCASAPGDEPRAAKEQPRLSDPSADPAPLWLHCATFWTIGGQLAQPLYTGGRITSQYRLALAQRDQADLTYRQTVQQAFADVSNSLVGYRQSRLYRVKLQEQAATYKETSRLANVRFTGGATSFLEVLTTQQQYFTVC